MNIKAACFLTFLILVLVLSSCNIVEIRDESPAVNRIRPETKFRINLPEDHRTGYTWQITDDYDKDHVERLNEVWHGNDKGLDCFFKTHSTGQTTLTFVMRKFTDTSDIRKYIVKIEDY